ncbi:Cut9-interacting protein scn1 [Acrodontium crateriforme]|uniref:Cut9-interacting protein scn1 n=1 Tax=Acrodontium crateriforme TaxID=150365 RepID=A0AAQ3LY38_9PEZI|nr:Cut9-interacting protein scn1 [Acrodontium crateriforme]
MADDRDVAPFPAHLGVFDAHCHPTDTLNSLQSLPSMKANVLTIMATRAEDQELVAQAADEYGVTGDDIKSANFDWSKTHKILPAFGWHPWFSHQMFDEAEYDGATTLSADQKVAHYQSVLVPKSDDRDFLLSLPDPRPFASFINQLRDYLSRYPLALVGEVGLDKSFRIPEAWLPEQAEQRNDDLTPGGREGRRLSPYRVSVDHQRRVLNAQLVLAGKMSRAVSLHGVAAHGVLYEALAQTWQGHERHAPSKRERRKCDAIGTMKSAQSECSDESSMTLAKTLPYPPRVCLHSYSGPAETVKMYTAATVPCEVYFSFSTTINAWTEFMNGKVEAAVRAVPDDKILIESDLHTAGERMDNYLQEAARKICQIKGWELDNGVELLAHNWKSFAFGST